MFPVYLAIDMDKQTYNFPLPVYWHALFTSGLSFVFSLWVFIQLMSIRKEIFLANKQDIRRPGIRDKSQFFFESIVYFGG